MQVFPFPTFTQENSAYIQTMRDYLQPLTDAPSSAPLCNKRRTHGENSCWLCKSVTV